MSVSFSILIVEDEIIIAQDLKEILEEVGYINVFRVANYTQAIQILNNQNIDLVLLDINLNDSNSGINLANYINQNHQIPFIYITSYSDAGTINEVKQTKPAAFLLKPFNKELLLATIEISLFNFSNNHNASNQPIVTKFSLKQEDAIVINNQLLVKENYQYIKVPLAEILWFESDRNYIQVITLNRKYLIRSSLKKLVEHLPQKDFVKCYKQFIINVNHVKNFGTDELIINGQQIPISRNNQIEVVNKLKNVDYIQNFGLNPNN
jgi:DNA-binding LytR/AlgR family response regulator